MVFRFALPSLSYTALWETINRFPDEMDKASTMPPIKPCVLCSMVAQNVQRSSGFCEDYEFVYYYQQIKSNTQCQTCLQIIEALHACRDSSPMDDKVVFIKFNEEFNCWILALFDRQDDPNEYDSDQSIMLIHAGEQPDAFEAIGVAVDQQRINLDRARTWISNCNRNHGGNCHTIADPWAKIEHATNLHFIDVERRCLVKQPGNECRYLALSYVWGVAANPFQTVISNYRELSQDGAFDVPANRCRLPKTIQDSMLLTQELGVKYLWIDRTFKP